MEHDISNNLCKSLVLNIDGVGATIAKKVVVATPVITITGNSCTISCDTTDAMIYYTLDGSTPTASSTQYSSSIMLNASCTVKAIAIKGGVSSAVASETYIQPVVATPVIIITDTIATIVCATSGVTIYYTLDGSTPTSESTEYTEAITLTQSCTIKAIAVKSGFTNSEVASEDYVAIEYLTAWRLVGNSSVHTDPYLSSWKVEGNSVIKSADYDILPQGYTRCKYLEAHGKEYIELPFGFDKTDEVYLKGAFTNSAYKDKYMVSPKVWNDNNNRFGLGTMSQNEQGTLIGYISCSFGSAPNVLRPLIEVSLDVFEFEYKDYICRVGNSSANYSDVTFGSTTQNLLLFYGHNQASQCKIYEYRHKKGNTEYHLIPCLDDNNVPCLYDTISGTTYYNDGTGTFGYETDNRIYSCGDLGQDGYYHVKISNGVNVYDIPLTEPLRKVNDVVDKIEFANGVATVTRALASMSLNVKWLTRGTNIVDKNRYTTTNPVANIKIVALREVGNILCAPYSVISSAQTYNNVQGIGVEISQISIYDANYDTDATAFANYIKDFELIYELATPTTETIQVSPFPISPTDTYTSQTETAYSAFTYTKNSEIWSCGELSATDNKYHIYVSSNSNVFDIALDEPLRKVDSVADKIEFENGVATVTRNIASVKVDSNVSARSSGNSNIIWRLASNGYADANNKIANLLCNKYNSVTASEVWASLKTGVGIGTSGEVNIYDENYTTREQKYDFVAANANTEVIYELATPTTETITVPDIEVSSTDTYTQIISQGAKAVEWSSFTPNPE